MKLSSGISFKAIASLALATFCVLNLHAQNAADRTARVTALAGDAKYSRAGGDFVPVSIGTRLGRGDVIRTGGGSHVDVNMGDTVGLIQVAPNSTLKVDSLTMTQTAADTLTDTQLTLSSGAMYFKVNKLAKGSRYEIATPKGIAGIRGTTGYLTADGQLTVGEGSAGIAFGANDVAIVNGGETTAPNDRPPHPSGDAIQHDIIEALRDASTHGIGREIQPFIPPIEPFISPTLPGN